MPQDTIEKRLMTVPFFGTCLASSEVTLVSKRINVPFRVARIRASFALNNNRTLLLRFFVSPDDTAPTTGKPTGVSILAERGQVDYITGDYEVKEFPTEILFKEAGYYIKVHATNNDTFDHTVDAQITVELLPRWNGKDHQTIGPEGKGTSQEV